METNITSQEFSYSEVLENRQTQPREEKENLKSHHAITIGKDPYDVFTFFRNFKNLPLFMKDLVKIDLLSDKRSHWTVQVKNGSKAEWDAEIIQEIPGELISWSSVEGSEVKTFGTVRFEKASADEGTVVTLDMDYAVPGGKLAEFILLFTGETPELLTVTNLKRLKAFLETGEIPTTEGQPSGREEEPKNTKH
jgi:uncharacterized membrane protein